MPRADHQFLGFSHLRYPSASNPDVTFAHRDTSPCNMQVPGLRRHGPVGVNGSAPKTAIGDTEGVGGRARYGGRRFTMGALGKFIQQPLPP